MAYDGLAYYDHGANTQDIDVSDILAEILKVDTTLIGLIGGPTDKVKTPEYYWIEDDLIPQEVTAHASTGELDATDADVTFDLVAGHGLRLREGCVLRDTASGKRETVIVTGISVDAITVTRDYGGIFATDSNDTHADGATWQIVAQPLLEASRPQTPFFRARTRVGNYTQIVERTLSISGTDQLSEHYAVEDEMAHQLEGRMREVKQEMDRTLISGVKSASVGSDSVYRTTKGLIAYLEAGNNFVTSAASIQPSVINDLAAKMQPYENVSNDLLVCSVSLARKISTFGENQVQLTRDDRGRGNYVTNFITDLGVTLRVVMDANVHTDYIMILDSSRIKLRDFRPVAVKPYDVGNDAIEKRILGEYGVEVRNSADAHAIQNNLS